MIVNGEEVEIYYPAYMSGNYSLMPVRAVVEQFYSGCLVEWDDDVLSIMFEGKEIVFTVGSEEYSIDGETYTLRNAAERTGNDLFISVRDLANVLSIDLSNVTWDSTTETATFTK